MSAAHEFLRVGGLVAVLLLLAAGLFALFARNVQTGDAERTHARLAKGQRPQSGAEFEKVGDEPDGRGGA